MNTVDRLNRLAAAPKPWRYVIRYSNGRERIVPALSETAARNGAAGPMRNIGRDVICRETGETTHIVNVIVERNDS